MSYETRAYDNPHGDPVVVLVAIGTHDVSRLVQLLHRGNTEQLGIGDKVIRQVRRHSGGHAALRLLRDHGGPDFTGEVDEVPESVAGTRAVIAELGALADLSIRGELGTERICERREQYIAELAVHGFEMAVSS